MPGCNAHGDFRAPKDRALSDHYWFCQEHITEYNRAWNFFEGMADVEVQEHMFNSLYGDRPTWKYGVNGKKPEEELFEQAWGAYNGDAEGGSSHDRARQQSYPGMSQHSAEYEALAIMGLEPPIDLEKVKAQYKKLAKKHHPDLNKGCPKSEELLKKINMAYTVLKLAYEKYDKLPERA